MYFVGPPPGPDTGKPDSPEPVPGFRTARRLDADAVSVTLLCREPSGGLAVVTVGRAPLPLGRRIEYLDWLERLAGVAEHRYVADVLAGGVTAEHRPYLAVRAGVETLADRLRSAGTAPAQVALALGAGLAEALGLAHERALRHGNVRPATVIIDAAGNPLLAGFDNTAPGMTRQPVPTPYAAPELLPRLTAGKPTASTAGDVYGLAATLSVMVSGALPNPAETPDGPLTRALAEGLAPDPGHRLTLAELRDRLAAAPVGGTGDPGRPIPDTLLGDEGVRPLAADDGDTEPPEPAEATAPLPVLARQHAVVRPATEIQPAAAGTTTALAVRTAEIPLALTAPEPTPRSRGWVARVVPVAVALLVLGVVALVAWRPWAAERTGGDGAVDRGPVQEAPAVPPTIGPGKTVPGPSSASPSPSRSSASPSRTPSRSPSPKPSPAPEREEGVAALAGRWNEVPPWEDGQSFVSFNRSGHMSLTGPFSCSGRASRLDNGNGQRTYELFHNCNNSGYALVVLSDDGQSMAIHWYQNYSDHYARA